MRAILTFHGIDDSGSVLSLAPVELADLVCGIRAAGHEIVPLTELLRSPEIDRRVALSFDDGFRSVHDAALPILRDAGAPATLFLTTGWLGRDNRWPGQPSFAPVFPMLSWEQVERLVAGGFTIEGHSTNHPDLCRLPDTAIEDELAQCDEAITRRLGRAPESFAYPYGAHDDRVVERVRPRYRWALTTRLSPLWRRDLDPHRLPRLDSYYLRTAASRRGFGSAPFRSRLFLRRALRAVRARVTALAHGS